MAEPERERALRREIRRVDAEVEPIRLLEVSTRWRTEQRSIGRQSAVGEGGR